MVSNESPVEESTAATPTSVSGKTQRRLTRSRLIIALLILFVVSIAMLTMYKFTAKNTDLNDVHVVKTAVGKHYLLPVNEEPALATVTDISKLTSTFKESAMNGDKILIYQTNRQAILYRPSIDRVVNIAPVVIDTPKNNSP